jgi:lipopolysaccharide biosynthesis regulator YciM
MAFRVFLPLFLIFFLFLYVALFNPGDAKFFYAQDRFVELPYVALVMLSFLAGALSLSLIHFFKGAGELINDFSNGLRRMRARRLESSFIKARRLALDGELGKAAATLEKILKKKPGHFNALVLKGSICRRTGRFEDALRAHSLALSERPADTEVIRQIGEDYRAAGNLEAAYRMLERTSADAQPSADTLIERRDLSLQAGRLDRAESIQKEIVSLVADEAGRKAGQVRLAEIQCLVGEQLVAERKLEDALFSFQAALKSAPDFVPAKILFGDVLVSLGRLAEAEEHFKRMFLQTGSLLPLLRIIKHGIGGGGAWLYGWALEHGSLVKADEAALRKLETWARSGAETTVNYRCGVCNSVEQDYFPQCPSCGAWNAVSATI